MDGLLIAEQLRKLTPLLPAARRPWRFPDAHTAVLPLSSGVSLWLYTRPPDPAFEIRDDPPPAAAPNTPFQEQLAARATGDLQAASQPELDRVLHLDFGAGDGFVPTPPLTLVAELTGRNANLILLDESGTILGVERPVTAQRNRYRELRAGLSYRAPPPYQKLNPLSASLPELRAALHGRTVAEVPRVVDGIGPQLSGALLAAAGSPPRDASLTGPLLEALLDALQRAANAPAALIAEFGNDSTTAPAALDLESRRAERLLEESRAALQATLERRLKLVSRRIADAERALNAAADSERLREEAALLLANAGTLNISADRVTVPAFEGGSVVLEVDPRLDAAANAAARYERAKRREVRAGRAREQLPALRRELEELSAAQDDATRADERRLAQLQQRWGEQAADTGSGAPRGRSAAAGRPGVRFVDPRGYEIYVGRSAKENDAITFKLARSRDLWLHVQGYRGAHVVVRAQGREIPFDTVLFAARLAAGFSQARHSDNVPVDYTERKNVWRPKGAAAGAVNFAHNKTVYVTPARDDEAAAAR